jgi:Anti-sigma-K factor rskA, C-terminal
MDHEGTREQLELAAVEPGGLDRLMAGDTPTAQAVAAHLAGCPSCTDELVRLQRASTLIRASVRELPPADLKERTLAAIRAEGVRRPLVASAVAASAASAVAASSAAAALAPAAGPVAAPATTARPVPSSPEAARRARRTQWLGWAGTIAAAVLLSVVTTTAVVNNRVDTEIAAANQEVAALEAVTTDTMGVAAQPDAEHVALRSVSAPAVAGELVYSASSTDLVVTATGLTEPPTGQQYRCWVEIGGQRTPVGRMFFSAHLAYWNGPVPVLKGLEDGATFGVSLVSSSGDSVDSTPVLVGDL